MFNKVNGFIRDYDATNYLVLFGLEKYSVIYGRIRYLKRLQTLFVTIFKTIRSDSDDDLLLETLTLHKVIILIKSALLLHHILRKLFVSIT